MGEPPINHPPGQPTFWQDLASRLTSRKFWVAIAASIAAYTFAMQDGVISPNETWQIIIPILAYLGVNGATEVVKANKD